MNQDVSRPPVSQTPSRDAQPDLIFRTTKRVTPRDSNRSHLGPTCTVAVHRGVRVYWLNL